MLGNFWLEWTRICSAYFSAGFHEGIPYEACTFHLLVCGTFAVLQALLGQAADGGLDLLRTPATLDLPNLSPTEYQCTGTGLLFEIPVRDPI